MNFQDLTSIEDYQFYLDVAFKKAQKRAIIVREGIKREKSRLLKSQKVELEKLMVIKGVLRDKLMIILTSYPSINRLPPFYQKLINLTIEYDELKKSLGAVNWAANKVNDVFTMYNGKIKRTKDFTKINVYRREFYGRISSVLRQINKNLLFLEDARKIMKGFPAVKTSVPSIVLYGFPNVGKTTLLYKLTGSKPEINSYPFTTRSINISYIKEGKDKIQLLDVPGTLNRDKQNDIEKQAELVVTEIAELIVYIFDLTEAYPLKDQINLFEDLKKYNKKMIVFFSKKDLIEGKIDDFKKNNLKGSETYDEAGELKRVLLSVVSTEK